MSAIAHPCARWYLPSPGPHRHPKGSSVGDRENRLLPCALVSLLCSWRVIRVPCSTKTLSFVWWERCRREHQWLQSTQVCMEPEGQAAFRLRSRSPFLSFIVSLFIFRWLWCSTVTQLVSNWPGRFSLLSSCSLAEQSLEDLYVPAPAWELWAKPPPEERKFLLTDVSVWSVRVYLGPDQSSGARTQP